MRVPRRRTDPGETATVRPLAGAPTGEVVLGLGVNLENLKTNPCGDLDKPPLRVYNIIRRNWVLLLINNSILGGRRERLLGGELAPDAGKPQTGPWRGTSWARGMSKRRGSGVY